MSDLHGWAKEFADYTLTTIEDGERVQVYRLTSPRGGEMQSVRIAFLPGPYIVIHGDLCPGRVRHDNKGIVSHTSYGRDWFSRPLSRDYLCEKFAIERVFRPDLAAAWLNEAADEADGTRAELLRSLATTAETLNERDDGAVSGFLAEMYEHEMETEFCYGHDHNNAELLVAIQATFRRLWAGQS